MRITGLIWLEEVVEKIETKHSVSIFEVEEIFLGKFRVKKMHKGHFHGEDVYRALRQTNSGRYLAIFFIYKLTHEALILSAREMDRKERKSYGKK